MRGKALPKDEQKANGEHHQPRQDHKHPGSWIAPDPKAITLLVVGDKVVFNAGGQGGVVPIR
jgi:hypothetical protein